MSFGCAVGDVIAVLGLFERVSIELRNYKNAPAHFQQLTAEIDLLRSTLQHVLRLNPGNQAEIQTLEQIRAIAMHCLQPLQALADKMQVKENSLGHFRTTRSLSTVGTRLHWSMIAQKDVDELRKVILSEMVAITMLLSVQQLSHMKHFSSVAKRLDDKGKVRMDTRSDVLIKQTSSILELVSATPQAIDDLRLISTAQAKQQTQQVKLLYQGFTDVGSKLKALSSGVSGTLRIVRGNTDGIRRSTRRLLCLIEDIKELILLLGTCTKEMLQAIGRNTRELLEIASQMKRLIRAVEAIPLHLTLDIIRFDDVWEQSWALPFQACSTWPSFQKILHKVVFGSFKEIIEVQHCTMLPPHDDMEPSNWD
ncbi:hypothetical protein F5Y04DRAFT_291644 [Hypomontagnella monticulosa]|nr:hypothetical protein F5Y04DRAFT_291644 [Hypomontagnella monticulosa]